MGDTSVPPEPGRSEQLLARARAGEAEAFCALAMEHEARLLRQAFGLARDLSIAEDLVAETMVEAWRSLQRFDGSCRFSTWLFSILLHRYQKEVRRAHSRPLSAALLPPQANSADASSPDGHRSPSEELEQSEKADALHQALALLPEKQRQVLHLRFFQDCSLEEIARVLGCSVGTVKSRLHYGLETLRRAEVEMNLQELRRDT